MLDKKIMKEIIINQAWLLNILLISLAVHPMAFASSGETQEIQFLSGEATKLRNKVDELATPVNTYEYVRNNFEYAIYHGSRSGSVNTFQGRRGNDVDLASALIAMFRYQGIPARYVVGQIRVPADKLMNWQGVQDFDLALAIMNNQGIQNISFAANKSYAEFEHVWVEAHVALDNYRGAGANANDRSCESSPANCVWVALDPSFKLKEYPDNQIDIYDAVKFDYTSYYNAIKNDDPAYKDKNPREIYEEQILTYLRTNHPGKTLEDVAYQGEIIREESLILPTSLPYAVVGSVRRYSSVAEHDASSEPVDWAKTIAIDVFRQQTDANGNLVLGDDNQPVAGYTMLSNASIFQSDLATKALTLTFNTVDSSDPDCSTSTCVVMVVRLAGNIQYRQVYLSSQVQESDSFMVQLSMEGSPTSATPINATYYHYIVGGYYLVGVGGDSSNWGQVHASAEALLQAGQTYPIVKDSNDVPYVDANGNGSIDAGEVKLIDDDIAMDALTGGLLDTALRYYYARSREDFERVDRLAHIKTPIEGLMGIVSSVNNVQHIDGTAFSITPAGLLIDMKGQRLLGNWRINTTSTPADDHFELLGHVGSSLEHEVWQELTGFDAISTVRGIQKALADGALIVNPKKNSTTDNVPFLYSEFGFSATPPLPATEFNKTVYTKRPTLWVDCSTWPAYKEEFTTGSTFASGCFDNAYEFDFLKKTIDSSTVNYRRGVVRYAGTVFPWPAEESPGIEFHMSCFDDIDDNGYYPGQSDSTLMGLYEENGKHYRAICGIPVQFQPEWGDCCIYLGTLRSAVQPAFNNYMNSIDDYFRYIDRDRGFVRTEYVYRDSNPASDMHSSWVIKGIRDNLYLTPSPRWVEYVIPSRRTIGDQNAFSVYLLKGHYQATVDKLYSLTFAIQNESLSANGGYVDSWKPVVPSFDWSGINYNNNVFTNLDLIGSTNNNWLYTPSTWDPVSTVTGNMYHDETDVIIRGRGLDVAFTRTYNSVAPADATDKPIGYGWTHSYNMQLKSNDYGDNPNAPEIEAPLNYNGTTSSITYVDERGGEYNYLVDDSGTTPTWAVTPPKLMFDDLALDIPSAGFYTLTFRNGVKYVFEGQDLKISGNAARLAHIEDAYGNQLTLTYNASGQLTNISDGLSISGRTGLTLSYYADGRLQDIQDWTGRTWMYVYDSNGNLTFVTNPLSEITQYDYYLNSNDLKEVIKPEDRNNDGAEGDVRTTFGYYQNGRAFNYYDAQGNTEFLDYDLYRKRTRVTDPRGNTREYFYDKNGALTKLTEPDKGILLFENNTDGLRYKKTSTLGYTTIYSYRTDLALGGGASDTNGNVTLEKDSLGNTLEYDYGIYDQITRIQDKNGNVRRLYYYATTDAATGAVAGKLEKITATVNGAPDVILQTHTYYPGGNPKRSIEYIDPADLSRQRVTDYVYDPSGLKLEEILISGSGNTIRHTFTYDDLGRKETETLWRRVSATDATLVPLTTTYAYDNLDRVISVTDALGNYQQTAYDENGKVSQVTGYYKKPDNSYDTRLIIRNTYDTVDRLVKTADIYGNETHYTHDENGNILTVTDANGHTTHYIYDAMNRRVEVRDANGNTTRTVYNLAGQVIAVIDANNQKTSYEYDAVGNTTKIVDPLNNETRFQYDANGNRTHIIDANAVAGTQPTNSFGATVYQEYDELNRLTRTGDALEGATRYTYDLLSNITSIQDAEGRTTSFVYNDLGQLTTVIDPLVETPADKVTTYTYDEAGNVLTKADRKGQVTRYTYDKLNRLDYVDYADDSYEDYSYDIYGNLETVSNANVTYSYTYDLKNRLKSKTDSRQNRNLAYDYDNVGNLIQKTDYQNEVTDYRYDSTNRLVSLRNPAYLSVSYDYDPAGRLQSRILSNNAKTDYTYYANGWLKQITNWTANRTDLTHAMAYEYDKVGNINKITDGRIGATEYTYNARYQLEQFVQYGDYTAPPFGGEKFTYDEVGNRRLWQKFTDVDNLPGTVTSALAYIYDAGNRLRQIHQNTDTGPLLYQYAYDDNGNLSAKATGSAYVYILGHDAGDRVTQINTASGLNTYQYDPYRYRIQKTDSLGTNRYLLEAEHLEAVYDETNAIRAKYLRGVVIDEIVNGYQYEVDKTSPTNLTYHHDHLQSMMALSAHEGTILEYTGYDPFGNVAYYGSDPKKPVDNPYLKYTGREYDPNTGLYYYRARYYDPNIGRFINEDSLGFQAGVNFYAYANNNPINFKDPFGEDVFGINVGGEVIVDHTCFTCNVPGGRVSISTVLAFDTDTFELGLFAQKEIGLGKSTGIGSAGLFVNALVGGEGSTFNDLRGKSLSVGGSFGFPNNTGVSFSFADPGIDSKGPQIYELGFSPRTTQGPALNVSFGNTVQIGRSSVMADFRDSVNRSIVSGLESLIGGRTINDFLEPSSSNGVSGGFAPYPSKPNTNQLRSVYRK